MNKETWNKRKQKIVLTPKPVSQAEDISKDYQVTRAKTETKAQFRAKAHNASIMAHNAAQANLPKERQLIREDFVQVPDSITLRRVKPKASRKSLIQAAKTNSKKFHKEYARIQLQNK